jgi:FkbM family methyltransferase
LLKKFALWLLRPILLPLVSRLDLLIRSAVLSTGLVEGLARVEFAAGTQKDDVTNLISSLVAATAQNQERLSAALDALRIDTQHLPGLAAKIEELRSDISSLAGRLDTLDLTLNGLAGHLNGLVSLGASLGNRIDHLIRRAALLPCGDDVLARTPAGWLFAPGSDLKLLAALYETGGVLEPGTTAIIERLLQPGATVLDVGAHIGLMSLPVARRVGDRGHVIAIEPVPRLVELLRRSLILNELDDRVVLHCCAAGNKRARRDLNVARVFGHSSLLPLASESERIGVDVVPLDDLVPAGTEVSLVKLDVEGYELSAWRGMGRIISENPDLIVIVEFGPSHLARANNQISDWLAELASPGFTAYEIDEIQGTCRPLRSKGLEEIYSVNLLLARQTSRRLAEIGVML